MENSKKTDLILLVLGIKSLDVTFPFCKICHKKVLYIAKHKK
jgi:hypothetical protein